MATATGTDETASGNVLSMRALRRPPSSSRHQREIASFDFAAEQPGCKGIRTTCYTREALLACEGDFSNTTFFTLNSNSAKGKIIFGPAITFAY